MKSELPSNGDPLERMAVHRHARKLIADSWDDVVAMQSNSGTAGIVGQFRKSVGSIAANIAEGYSKSSGRERAHGFEYALGSARETVEWYATAEPVLDHEVIVERLELIGQIQRLLVAIIPPERERTIAPRNRRKPK